MVPTAFVCGGVMSRIEIEMSFRNGEGGLRSITKFKLFNSWKQEKYKIGSQDGGIIDLTGGGSSFGQLQDLTSNRMG